MELLTALSVGAQPLLQVFFLLCRGACGIVFPQPDVKAGLPDQSCRSLEAVWQIAQSKQGFGCLPAMTTLRHLFAVYTCQGS